MQKIFIFSLGLFIISSNSFSQNIATIDSAIRHNDSLAKAGDEVVFTKVDEEAEFPGGVSGWREYLQAHLNADIPIKKGAPAGIYTVIVAFIVSKVGTISDIKAETNLGYGMEEEVIRVIRKGPNKWIPAMRNGRKVNAYRRQPVTFVISNQ
jgi:protein TonB